MGYDSRLDFIMLTQLGIVGIIMVALFIWKGERFMNWLDKLINTTESSLERIVLGWIFGGSVFLVVTIMSIGLVNFGYQIYLRLYA